MYSSAAYLQDPVMARGFTLPKSDLFLQEYADFYQAQWDAPIESENTEASRCRLAASRLEQLPNSEKGRVAFHALQSKFMKWAVFPQYGTSIQLTPDEAWLLGFDGNLSLSLRPEDIRQLYDRLNDAIKIINGKYLGAVVPEIWDQQLFISNTHLQFERRFVFVPRRQTVRRISFTGLYDRILAAYNDVPLTLELLKSCLGQLRKLYRKLRVLQYAQSQALPRLNNGYSQIRLHVIFSGIPQPTAKLNSTGLFNFNRYPVGFDHDPLFRFQYSDSARSRRRKIDRYRAQRPQRCHRPDTDSARRQRSAPDAFSGRSAQPLRPLGRERLVRYVHMGQK
jgi:hypothetical protein